MRTLPSVIVVLVLAVAAGLVAAMPGTVIIHWHDREIYTDVRVLVAGTLMLAALGAFLFLILYWIVRGPGAFLRARRERRRRDGYRALTQGMVAVAAGDADEAQRLARRADVLLAEPPLTLLLSAQAAQLKGDEQAAARYFSAMLDRAETEFLGLRGLIMQALRREDEATALELAERARALRPKTPWVTTSLFELQARAGQWAAADATLADAAKRKTLPAPVTRHQRAVLHLEQSREAAAAGGAGNALKLAAKAHALDPGFAAAAVHYAGLLRIGGRLRHARKVIEEAWRAAPHPSLAAAYEEIHADATPLARVKQFERLAALAPAHVESSLALAAAAFKARLWGEARRHLHLAGANSASGTGTMPSPRVCQAMAALEEAEHGDHPASKSWLARAATTPTADPAYQCRVCGAEHQEWSALCPDCRSFASLEWRVPSAQPAPRARDLAGDLAPALPVPVPWSLDGAKSAPPPPAPTSPPRPPTIDAPMPRQ